MKELIQVAFILLFFGFAWGARAQTPPGGVPIPSFSDFGDPGDQFGTDIASDGNWAVVTGSEGEAFYVYEYVGTTWHQRQQIVPPTLGQVGPVSTELLGNRLIISRAFGIPGDSSGRVYLYERINPGAPFFFVTTLVPGDPQAGDRFGYGVALSSDRVFVGASGRDEGSNADQGVVYVFQNQAGSWVQEARLAQTDSSGADRFGFGLDYDGQDILVGARRHRPTPSTRGAVYVYRLVSGQWAQVQKLPGTNNSQFGFDIAATFGRAVIVDAFNVFIAERDIAGVWNQLPQLPDPVSGLGSLQNSGTLFPDIDGDVIAVSSATDDPATGLSGPSVSVTYHFDGSTWQRVAQLLRTDGVGAGTAPVRLGSDFMLVGAPLDDAAPKSPDQGSLSSYSLVNGAATLRQRIWHGSGNVPDYLGKAVAIDGAWALVSAPGADLPVGGGGDLGEVYFMHNLQGVWSFGQVAGTSAALGTPTNFALFSDLAFIAYPDHSASGQPDPIVRVMQRQLDDRWTFLCDLKFDTAGIPQRLADIGIAASASGVLVSSGFRDVIAYPLPATGTCPSGTLLSSPSSTSPLVSISLSGAQAVLVRSQVPIQTQSFDQAELFEFLAGNWSLIQTITSPLPSDGFDASSLDGTRLALLHSTRVGVLDSRSDIDLYEWVAGSYVFQRTILSPTATSGFSHPLVVAANSILVGDPSIGQNSGIAVFDFVSAARTQNIVPNGLNVEDRMPWTLAVSGSSGIFGYPWQNRDAVNHSGMVYSLEFAPAAGARIPATWSVIPMTQAPRTDRVFSHFFEEP